MPFEAKVNKFYARLRLWSEIGCLMAPVTPSPDTLVYGWTPVDRGRARGTVFDPLVAADGVCVVDEAGTEFLDARSLVWNVSFGHGQQSVAAAVTRQLAQLACGPTIDGHSTPAVHELAHKLISTTRAGFRRVYLSLSGSAANEVAISLARHHFDALRQPERRRIVALNSGYHGQSFGTLPLAGFPHVPKPVDPEHLGYAHVPNCYCYRCPVGRDPSSCDIDCAASLIARIEALGPKTVAALIIEPVQGAVVHAPPKEWFRRVSRYLRETGILLIVDEVANGFGRLGADFGYRAFEIEPDILTLAKAITNGALPLAATLATDRVMAPLEKAGWTPVFGSTQDGNPVCAAAANAVLELFAGENWGARAQASGEVLHAALVTALGDHPNVGDIRGIGLFRAVELVDDRGTKAPFRGRKRLAAALRQHRLLVQADGNAVVFAPALTTPHETLAEIAQRFAAALQQVTSPTPEGASVQGQANSA